MNIEAAGPWTGKVLGGSYRVATLLGQGGMGAVYQGVQESLHRRVAIKVLHPHLAQDASLVARFELEARAAAGLGHPHIVSVTDFQQPEGEPAFLVMELLSGASLREVIATEGPLAYERVAFIASQVLSALEAAHGAGIVHRDLKPDNVFLTSLSGVRDVVKVLDFGIAKLTPSGTSGFATPRMTVTGDVLGTPGYMSPEQARGQDVDLRTDLYATGALMYHALAGRPPFAEANYNAQIAAILERAPAPLSTLCSAPAALCEVVERAMAKRLDDRFSSAGEMAAALEPFVRATSGGMVSTPRLAGGASTTSRDASGPASDPYAATAIATPLSQRAAPSTGRKRPLVALAVVAFAFVALGASVAAWLATLDESDRGASDEGPSAAVLPPVPTPPMPAPVVARTPRVVVVAPGLETTVPRAQPIGDEEAAPPPRKRRKRAAVNRSRPRSARVVRVTGGITNHLYALTHVRSRLVFLQGRMDRCFTLRASPTEPRQHIDLVLEVTPQGRVRAVGVPKGLEHDAALLSCLRPVLTGVELGPPAKPTPDHFRIFFSARVKQP